MYGLGLDVWICKKDDDYGVWYYIPFLPRTETIWVKFHRISKVLRISMSTIRQDLQNTRMHINNISALRDYGSREEVEWLIKHA